MIEVENEEPDPKIVRRLSCKNCGARLRYVPRDVRTTQHTDYGGGTDTYYWIDCPKCKHANEVKQP
jgi:RNase P subunit RPR2